MMPRLFHHPGPHSGSVGRVQTTANLVNCILGAGVVGSYPAEAHKINLILCMCAVMVDANPRKAGKQGTLRHSAATCVCRFGGPPLLLPVMWACAVHHSNGSVCSHQPVRIKSLAPAATAPISSNATGFIMHTHSSHTAPWGATSPPHHALTTAPRHALRQHCAANHSQLCRPHPTLPRRSLVATPHTGFPMPCSSTAVASATTSHLRTLQRRRWGSLGGRRCAGVRRCST